MINLSFEIALFRCALIIVLGLLTYRFLRHGIGRLHDRGYFSTNAEFLLAITLRWTMIVVGAILLVQAVGVSMHALWTALSTVLVMVAIGFVALWSILSNLLCAVLLVIFAPFRIGDEIELIEVIMSDETKQGIRGRVVEINLLYTILEDLSATDGGKVRIPNNLLFQRAIRTIEGDKTRSLGNALFHQNRDGE